MYCLMNEIFGRLPVKQLAQWKIVSKEWNKMIKENLAHRCLSSVFVTTLEHPDRVAAIRFYCENECCIEKFEVPALRTLEFPISILGSCHDLVCIGDKGQNTILVINPSKKLYWQIEEEETEEIGDYGFGFDKVNDDYKIIKIYSVFIENYVETHAIVYSVKESGWRKINFPHLEICCDSCAGFLDPKVYWHDKSKDSLITFDLSIQDFDTIKLPEALQQDDDRSINFGVVRELPSAEGTEILLACSYEFENWGEKKFSELWKITKANQFEKMATLVHNDGVMWPLCYHHSQMIIVVLEAHRKIKLYNLVDNSETHILCFGSLFDYPKIAAIGFLDNLLSPTNLPDDGSPLQGGCSVMKVSYARPVFFFLSFHF